MQEPHSLVTVRGQGEYYCKQDRATVTERMMKSQTCDLPGFILIDIIESMQYKELVVSIGDIVTVKQI